MWTTNIGVRELSLHGAWLSTESNILNNPVIEILPQYCDKTNKIT